MEAPTVLAIEGIRKRFGTTQALGGCGFAVAGLVALLR